MPGFTINDMKVASSQEEDTLKLVIAEAWVSMKRTNWDDTKFCTVTPSIIVSYSMAKNFQTFFENDGWSVTIKRANRNYLFDVYQLA